MSAGEQQRENSSQERTVKKSEGKNETEGKRLLDDWKEKKKRCRRISLWRIG